MKRFKAIYDNSTITISTDTYWKAMVTGNVTLSSYNGSGNTVISVIMPDYAEYIVATVYFSYGDKYCPYHPYIYVSEKNPNYLNIVPNPIILNGKNSVTYATITSTNTYILTPVGNKDKFTVLELGDSKLMVMSDTDNPFGSSGETSISINNGKYGNSKNVQVLQYTESNNRDEDDDDYCILLATYNVLDEKHVSVEVTSLIDGQFASFTWDDVNDVIITKTDTTKLLLTITSDTLRQFDFTIYNACDTDGYTFNINTETSLAAYVFDVAVECGGKDLSAGKSSLQMSILAQTVSLTDDEDDIINSNREFSGTCNGNNCRNV